MSDDPRAPRTASSEEDAQRENAARVLSVGLILGGVVCFVVAYWAFDEILGQPTVGAIVGGVILAVDFALAFWLPKRLYSRDGKRPDGL